MKRVHLICNAHIDPIWQWTWDEGISAAIATFKSAADLADEFDYIFCHNESLLYEAIEKHAPDLFARIQRLVKEGKWKITGGWYLQPDCLMPAGETFVRQMAEGKRYFREKFGVEPCVATNYDSFGHSVGLVQILAKHGYKGYLHCRPNKTQFEYPSKFYRWVAPDGSAVLASETFSYSSLLGQVKTKILSEVSGEAVGMLGADVDKNAEKQETGNVDYVLWGVGNHGGGPSRKDLRDIAEIKIDGVELIHSTPEALLADTIDVGGDVTDSLVTCMPGCYSSMARIKQGYRKAENLFYAAEKMIAAAMLAGQIPDLQALSEAEKRMMLATFHDILPGTCIEDAEEEGLELLKASQKTSKEYRTAAFLYLVMGQKPAGEGEYPVFVFNCEPKEVNAPVEVEFMLADQNWSDKFFEVHIYDTAGNELPCQQIKEGSTLNQLDWRKRVVFEAKLDPLCVTRFTVKTVIVDVPEKKTGESVRLSALLEGTLLDAPVGLEMSDDTADPWGMSADELKGMGKNPRPFRLMTNEEASAFCAVKSVSSPVRLVEDGAVRTAVEALYTCENTNAVVQYKRYKNYPYLDLKVTVEFADKNKLVRLKVPVPSDMKGYKTVGDGPFVWEEKPACEVTFQKWLGAKKDDCVFAVINDGVYAGKEENGYLYLTLLRGAGYCFHPLPDRPLYPDDRYLPRIDCGRYTYNIRLYRGSMYEVNAMAESFNQPPYAVNVFPTGGNERSVPRVLVEGEVIATTVKPKEGGGLVIRLYNPARERRAFSVKIGDEAIGGEAGGAEVVSVVYENGEFTVCHDEMPV